MIIDFQAPDEPSGNRIDQSGSEVKTHALTREHSELFPGTDGREEIVSLVRPASSSSNSFPAHLCLKRSK